MIINNGSYKRSLIFAISLHAVLIIFLLIKFTASRSVVAFSATSDFINATAINERDFDDQMNKIMINQKTVSKQEKAQAEIAKQQQISLPDTAVKKPVIKKEQLQSVLQKNLLTEQAKEIAELKKERQKYKKNVIEQKQRQMQKVFQDQILAEQKQLADEQIDAHGHRLQGEADKYNSLILQAINLQWNKTEGDESGSFCQLLVNVAPGGVVLNVQLLSSSGNLALDRSAKAAVLKASPLPVPEDIKLFEKFRVIKLTFRPEGIVGN